VNLRTDNNFAVSSRLDWRRSTYCGSEGCIEVAILDDKAYVRSSKDAAGAYMVFDIEEWRNFLAGVRDHQFDID
jgi:hypothetical protein